MTGRRCGSVRAAVLRTVRHSPHLTYVQIAAVVGCHRSTVRKHLRGHRNSGLLLPRPAGRADVADAADVACRMLARLAADPAWEVRRAAARDLRTSAGTLTRLAGDPVERVRRSVAANPNSPPRMLARLAGDVGEHVRWQASNNPNSPPRMLARLAGDAYTDVRIAVAANQRTPPGVLARLTTRCDEYVRREAAHNANVADGSGAIVDG